MCSYEYLWPSMDVFCIIFTATKYATWKKWYKPLLYLAYFQGKVIAVEKRLLLKIFQMSLEYQIFFTLAVTGRITVSFIVMFRWIIGELVAGLQILLLKYTTSLFLILTFLIVMVTQRTKTANFFFKGLNYKYIKLCEQHRIQLVPHSVMFFLLTHFLHYFVVVGFLNLFCFCLQCQDVSFR